MHRPDRRVLRFSRAALEKLKDLHGALAGQPAVVDLGLPPAHPSTCAGVTAGLLQTFGDVRLDVRPPTSVARSGGAFCVAGRSRPTCAEWWSGAAGSLVFDTNRRGELHGALLSHGLATVPLGALEYWSRSPIATLGRPCGSEQAAGGLAFHRHERNWLYLLSGRKRWYFAAAEEVPSTAFARVSEANLLAREADGALLAYEQRPGEAVLLPDGLWHCTYNVDRGISDGQPVMTFGVGGMGACNSALEIRAAVGDIGALRSSLAEFTTADAAQVARVAAEQGQLDVLELLNRSDHTAALFAADERGATPLHFAAAAGALAIARWLLDRGADAAARDMHAATPAHWVARSGSPELLAMLLRSGADLEAADEHSGCQPLHLLAAEGHLEAVQWMLSLEAGVNPAALDGNGRTPAAWAAAAGHSEIVGVLLDVAKQCYE